MYSIKIRALQALVLRRSIGGEATSDTKPLMRSDHMGDSISCDNDVEGASMEKTTNWASTHRNKTNTVLTLLLRGFATDYCNSS
jgi:hypothetical protein